MSLHTTEFAAVESRMGLRRRDERSSESLGLVATTPEVLVRR